MSRPWNAKRRVTPAAWVQAVVGMIGIDGLPAPTYWEGNDPLEAPAHIVTWIHGTRQVSLSWASSKEVWARPRWCFWTHDGGPVKCQPIPRGATLATVRAELEWMMGGGE